MTQKEQIAEKTMQQRQLKLQLDGMNDYTSQTFREVQSKLIQVTKELEELRTKSN